MGIKDLLPHLPGGGANKYKISFYELGMEGKDVPFDAAGALFDCAAKHAADYLRGNYIPALIELTHLLVHMRSVCKMKLRVYLDGRENAAKSPEIARRQARVEAARLRNDLRGQIKNTPEYIAAAVVLCNFLSIPVIVSAYEADPQVSYAAMAQSLTPITGDSDLLAYGIASRIVIVKGYCIQQYRLIDLDADVGEGEYPLLDLYRKWGRIVFQLYAACRGCDFTALPSGISGVGYETFLFLVSRVEGDLSAKSLALSLWSHHEDIATKNGFKSADDVGRFMQHVVDVYALGLIYDGQSNIIDMTGRLVVDATTHSKRHMLGDLDSRTGEEFSDELRDQLQSMDCSQLNAKTAADASAIRGVKLPDGKAADNCHVPELRDFVAARGGKISMARDDLVSAVKCYQFIEQQVPKAYVDRNPDPNGLLYTTISTSCTRSIEQILHDLNAATGRMTGHQGVAGLIRETFEHYHNGLFEDRYDNIARVAPELKEDFIYRQFGHIGASICEKNIGDALKRCFYDNETSYHAIAFVPNTNKVIILSKAHASMARDEKTRSKTDDGQPPKKNEYLLMMELFYKKSDEIELGHSLGVFTTMGRSYCTSCIAGLGNCRHRSERLWYQYHHWTPERLGIDRPSTLLACSWAPGGKALVCDVRAKIHEQQTVKMEATIKGQTAKLERGVKRDCTEGRSCDYEVHLNIKKRGPQPGRFTKERTRQLFELLRKN